MLAAIGLEVILVSAGLCLAALAALLYLREGANAATEPLLRKNA